MAKAIKLAAREWVHNTQTLYRLSAPLQDCWPAWRNVMVNVRHETGERTISRAWAYEKPDGTWAAVPGDSSWLACYCPLTERDLAFVESEIA